MKIVAFIIEPAVVDRIIDHLKLTFVAEKPSSRVFEQVALMAVERQAPKYLTPHESNRYWIKDHIAQVSLMYRGRGCFIDSAARPAI